MNNLSNYEMNRFQKLFKQDRESGPIKVTLEEISTVRVLMCTKYTVNVHERYAYEFYAIFKKYNQYIHYETGNTIIEDIRLGKKVYLKSYVEKAN